MKLSSPHSCEQLVKLLVLPAFILAGSASGAVIGWDSITTTKAEGTPTIDPNNGYVYENDVTLVTSFSAGGGNYSPLVEFPIGDFTLKSNPAQTRVWYERNNIPSNGNPTGYTGSALDDLSDMFDTPLRINFGSDDTFRKTLDSVRFTNTEGVQINDTLALTGAGVSIIERGANDNNFTMRVIMSVDGAGNALTYSSPVTVGSGDPFGSGVGNMNHALWDSATTDGVGPFDILHRANRNQNIGGLILTFDEFGLNVGDRIYGYEISAAASGTRTGLDLLSSGAAFQLDTLPAGALSVVPNPEPQSRWLALTVALFAAFVVQRRRPSSLRVGP